MNIAFALESLGIAGLVDACDLRNCTSAPVTINGRVGSISGTLNSNADGVVLDGTYATFPALTDLRPFTIVADITGNASPVAGWGGIIYVSAANGANGGGAQGLTHNGGGAVVFGRDSAGQALLTSALGVGSTALGISANDPTQKIAAFTYDGAYSVSAWVDGKHIGSTAIGTVLCDSPLTQLTFGAKHNSAGNFSDFHRATVRSWAAFNRVLTPSEHMAVANALMSLDRRNDLLLTLGDSMTAQLAPEPTANWPYQLSRSIGYAGKYRLLNHAVNGSPATSGLPNWNRRASGYTIPTTCIIWHGTAGVLLNYSAAQEWASIKTMLRQARIEGYRTVVCTVPRGQAGGFTAAQESERVALNVLIRAGTADYDALLDIEAIVDPLTDASYWTDAVHLNVNGKRIIANYIAGGGL